MKNFSFLFLNLFNFFHFFLNNFQPVLLYHVTEGRRAANSVVPPVKDRTIETLLGSTFTVSSNGMITAVGNSASIVKADISASNGVIHVIDTVILPIK